MLAETFAGTEPGLAEENLQARVRGTILMTMSNKFDWLVLTTGNKSEMATGYSTLYGDMAGGFAVIKDVPKMLVYALCEDLNRRAGREIVPRTVIEKPPSAELRPDQKDEDSLPPYAVLDQILEGYVEDDRVDRRPRRRGLRPRHGGARSRGWSTAPSTSAARPRPACGCRRRRSARTGGCRSPTAGPAERTGVGARCARTSRSSPSRWRPRCTARRSSSCRTRSTTSRRRRSTCCGSASPRSCCCRWCSGATGAGPTPRRRLRADRCVGRRCRSGSSGSSAYQTQNVGLHHTSTSNSSFITGLFVVFTPVIAAVALPPPAPPAPWSPRSRARSSGCSCSPARRSTCPSATASR